MSEFRVPFAFSNLDLLKKTSKGFLKFVKSKHSRIEKPLEFLELDITFKEYIAICYKNFIQNIIVFSVLFGALFYFLMGFFSIFYGILISFFVSVFIFFLQMNYPVIYSASIGKLFERHLLSALQDMRIQLDSGIPLFVIFFNISNSGYGALSLEFKKIVREINSGISQTEALEKHSLLASSKHFKRVLWQLGNGLKSGSDMSSVLENEIINLSDEQVVQIQSYGSRLNPLVMFFMLVAVIIPSLGITFLIIIASIVGLEEASIRMIFYFLGGFVFMTQLMFLGIIKAARPSLL